MSNTPNLPRARRVRKGHSPSPKHVVYLAAPITEYPTERYTQLAAVLRTRLVGWRVLEARGLYANTQDWLQKWPDILRTVSHVVFLSTPDGWIGKGVWREIQDALQQKLPVFYLHSTERLVPFGALTCSEPTDEYRRYVRVTVSDEA